MAPRFIEGAGIAMGIERRRMPRYPVTTRATYRLDGLAAWRDCRLIDLSEQGTAVELFGLDVDDWPTGAIEVRLPVLGAEIALTGEIRNARSFEGRMRVGIEFVDLSNEDRQMVSLLIGFEATIG